MVISGTTPSSSADLNDTLSSLTTIAPRASSSDTSSSATSSSNPDNLASEQTFLQLFVAQLQNQDPLDPNEQDPTQMVSELAQFSELEQLVNIGQNVQSIDQAVAPGTASSGSSQTGSSSENSNIVASASNQTAQ